MKVFVGLNQDNTVTVNNHPLDPRLSERNHSPTGFAWGYGGSGPSQLAYAILWEVVGFEKAAALYMKFKCDVIQKLNSNSDWTLSELDVLNWVSSNS